MCFLPPIDPEYSAWRQRDLSSLWFTASFASSRWIALAVAISFLPLSLIQPLGVQNIHSSISHTHRIESPNLRTRRSPFPVSFKAYVKPLVRLFACAACSWL